MPAPILATKLYVPQHRPGIVIRLRLTERLNKGLAVGCKLTLISASAGFGKTTLISDWIAGCGQPVTWLSLDEGDNDPTRFLAYVVAALQTIAPKIDTGVLAALQSSQPPPIESILTALLNEITIIPDNFILVLDDYHTIDSKPVDNALTFLLEHFPPQMHLVIASREDPHLPLSRLRARGQLTELRAADLRFTPSEAAEFLNQLMGLNLSAEDIAKLETRTEGWIAGLQLAALSMQGHQDAAGFIKSFTGSHRFVLDYLIEEVLQQQSESIQTFLLRTSILDRMCGSLCDAVLGSPSCVVSGQETLEYLDRVNLFIVPLDNERCWYRYHHLFGELLRQRLNQSAINVTELHIRASQWYEDNNLIIEAFHHATAANDLERAERLMESKKMPLHLRGTVNMIVKWLESLPKSMRDARPLLWVKQATMMLVSGQTTGVEEKLQAAESALQNFEQDDGIRDLIGQIACARATIALTHYQPEAMLTQARRALEYLHPDNLTFRGTANWILGTVHQFMGDRVAARQAFTAAITASQKSEDIFNIGLAMTGLGQIQELDNQLYQAAETYRNVLQLSGKYPLPNIAEVCLGLARIYYEWNDLEIAEQYGKQSLELSQQFDQIIDRFILSEIFLSRLNLVHGDMAGAAAMLARIDQTVRQKNFWHRLPEMAAAQVLILLHQGDVKEAAHLAQTYNLPLSQARVFLAQGDASAALTILEAFRQQMEAKGWEDERLRAFVLQALAFHLKDEKVLAAETLAEALALAEPGGFLRLFVDEGAPMAELLTRMNAARESGTLRVREYIQKLLAAFGNQKDDRFSSSTHQPLIEPLSQRELEVLRMIAQGCSNQEIGKQLFLALDTVKGHNRRIFDKLQVKSRTEAIARARELGLI